jgi:hypothetical protein
MTEQELVTRTMQNFVGGDDEFYEVFILDDLLATVILAGIGAIVGWLVKRCLNANFDAEKLDRLVRWGCKVAARTKEAKQIGLDPEGIYEQHGERLAFAITKTRKGLKRRDLRALERANPQPIGFANTPEFPEEA